MQFSALLCLIGAAAFRSLILPGAGLMPTVEQRVADRVGRFAAGSLLLLLATLPVRLWLQSVALHGPADALQPRLLAALLAELPWGRAWAAQLIACIVAGVGIVASWTSPLILAALLLAVTPAFQGHAATLQAHHGLAIGADALHVLAAGVWLGSLAAMLLAAIPALLRDGPERGGHDIARLLRGFAPLALAAASLLAIAGTISAALHFHSAAELLTTPYGRTLLVKLACFALVLAASWYGWKRAGPALPLHTGVRALRRAAALELLFAVATLAATVVLIGTPVP